MKLSTISCLLTLAASTFADYTNQSAPFALVLRAKNSSLDGATLIPCHEGAAIEGLCVSTRNLSNAVQFNFNTSSQGGGQFDSEIGELGILTWFLRGGANVSSGLTLSSNIATNVGIPLFFPGSQNAQVVAFDSHGLLNLQHYVDDRVAPPYRNMTAYYRWNICNTYWGYYYSTLAWVYGDGKPQNPTCEAVNVTRVWTSASSRK